MRKYIWPVALAAAVVGGALGCEGKGGADKAASAADTAARQPPSFSTFTDTRDGKVYRIVKIGRQNWFAENLNYASIGSSCYGEDGDVYDGGNEYRLSNAEVEANCAKYGRLYSWIEAKKVCPSGWHLPKDAEWTKLFKYAGGKSTAGKKLKSTSGWNNEGNGTDEYGFSTLPGGIASSVFGNAGYYGAWWSTNGAWLAVHRDITNGIMWRMSFNYDSVDRFKGGYGPTIWCSVRCVADKEAKK